MVSLRRAVAFGDTALDFSFGGLTTIPKRQYQRRKIDLCAYHHPNYCARLVPEMDLFIKVCNRSKKFYKNIIIIIIIIIIFIIIIIL